MVDLCTLFLQPQRSGFLTQVFAENLDSSRHGNAEELQLANPYCKKELGYSLVDLIALPFLETGNWSSSETSQLLFRLRAYKIWLKLNV